MSATAVVALPHTQQTGWHTWICVQEGCDGYHHVWQSCGH